MTDSTGNPMNNPEGIKALVAKLPRKVYPQGPNGPAYYVAKDVDAAIESLTAVAGDAEVVASKAKTQARAREMLAEEYDNEGMQVTASLVRNDRLMGVHRAAIRAIVRAMDTARQSEGMVLNQLVVEKVAENVRKWMGPVGQDLGAGHVATLHGTIMDAIRAAMLAAAPANAGDAAQPERDGRGKP